MRQILIPILIIVINNLAVAATDMSLSYKNTIEGNEQLSHKYRMASYLLTSSPLPQRIFISDDDMAKKLLSRARDNYEQVKEKIDKQKWLEVNAILDSVLRDLTAGAQLLNAENTKNRRYHEELRRVESFVLPKWVDISSKDKKYLQDNLKNIEKLRMQAEKYASEGDYDRAVGPLEKAYKLKALLIKRLKHEETIVYDLMFNSAEEEYTYMVNRTKHYIELVRLVLNKKDINIPMKNLIDTYIYEGNKSLNKAERLQAEGRHTNAVAVLNESINQLANALKIMGIKI